MRVKKEAMRLYAVTDRAWLKEGQTLKDEVENAIKGGATFIQLREKNAPYMEVRALALELKELCARYKVPFVIDDDVALAKEVDADGVHIGQSDMELKSARMILGSEKIIGVSADTVDTALAAERRGADYIGVGAVFHTDTKTDATAVSREVIRNITGAVTIPVVAIGGIKKDNVRELGGLGLDGIAVVSAIFAADDVYTAAKELRNISDEVFK